MNPVTGTTNKGPEGTDEAHAPCIHAAYEYREIEAVHGASAGRVRAVATGPINKDALRSAAQYAPQFVRHV